VQPHCCMLNATQKRYRNLFSRICHDWCISAAVCAMQLKRKTMNAHTDADTSTVPASRQAGKQEGSSRTHTGNALGGREYASKEAAAARAGSRPAMGKPTGNALGGREYVSKAAAAEAAARAGSKLRQQRQQDSLKGSQPRKTP